VSSLTALAGPTLGIGASEIEAGLQRADEFDVVEMLREQGY
jgi:hypothetical protein